MPQSQNKTPAKRSATGTSVEEQSWAPLLNLRDEIDSWFDNFYSGNALRSNRSPLLRPWPAPVLQTAFPSLDVIDMENEIKLCAELPGMKDEDIDVQVNDSTLTLSGEKKEEIEEGDEEGDYYVSERRFGAFKRTIRIPEGIDHDKIEAKFKDGVLTIHLPKKPEARQANRKIKVKAEA